jgi:hypothetical protein
MCDPVSYRRIHGSCHCGNINGAITSRLFLAAFITNIAA